MKRKLHKLATWFKSVGINTWLLLLILMMMFGEYSQGYYSGEWGKNLGMEIIAPYIYYASNIMAIIFVVFIVITLIMRIRDNDVK